MIRSAHIFCRRFPSWSLVKFTYSTSHNMAIVDEQGSHSYNMLYNYSLNVSSQLNALIATNSQPRHVSIILPRNVSFASAILGCWLSNSTAVPLDMTSSKNELEYFIHASKSVVVICPEDWVKQIREITSAKVLPWNDQVMLTVKQQETSATEKVQQLVMQGSQDNNFNTSSSSCSTSSMIVFTSGTTARPKGVVISRSNLQHRIASMQKAWHWTHTDCMLHCLPLHHVHGLENALLTPLASGATCKMLLKFHPQTVWNALLGSDQKVIRPNIFTAVPTMYTKLIDYHQKHFASSPSTQQSIQSHCQAQYRQVVVFIIDNVMMMMMQCRLMICGSASLPMSVLQQWQRITGQLLLERYGMTEIGMGLGQAVEFSKRIPGTVGRPIPGVRVRLVTSSPTNNTEDYETLLEADTDNSIVSEKCASVVDVIGGELLVKSASVFNEYFERENETKDTFTSDGWFITGDTAAYNVQTGNFSISGRTSVDIIKSSGFKISALDVERVLLEKGIVEEVAVFGLPHDALGEKIVAFVKLRDQNRDQQEAIEQWARAGLSKHSVPHDFVYVDTIPRNALGKVNKKQLKNEYVASLK